jgi:hypothetical protein
LLAEKLGRYFFKGTVLGGVVSQSLFVSRYRLTLELYLLVWQGKLLNFSGSEIMLDQLEDEFLDITLGL